MGVWHGPRTVVGEMYIQESDSFSLDFTAPADTYHALTGASEGQCKNVDVDGAAGTFTIEWEGWYKFDGVASLFPSAGMLIHFALFVNGVIIDKIVTAIDFKNNQDTQTFSGTGIVYLEKGDVVTVRGKTDTVPVTVNVPHFNINLFRISRS